MFHAFQENQVVLSGLASWFKNMSIKFDVRWPFGVALKKFIRDSK